MQAFFIPFISILLAEFGDKSQLSILLLASKTKKHVQLLLGVMLGFFLVDGVAILTGSYITSLIPLQYIKWLAGIVFLIFGILSFRHEKEESGKKLRTHGAFLSGFLAIAVSEFGDKTQLAAALFATEYNPWFVFLGVLSALFLLSVGAIFVGQVLLKKLNKDLVSKIAGIIFIILGLSFLLL